ncbi:MAG: hypothetical protein J1E85_06075 [Ruminococcus sp.]|nr:hypothetical protein [Ruminococcus sp.]
MPKYKIAGFIVEYTPKYDNLTKLSKPFLYYGDKETDITLFKSDEYIANLHSNMVKSDTIGQAEELAYATEFNRRIISHRAMLVHSSGIIVDGKAYLFSANSGVGKSTHTRLWKQVYGDDITYINDDKPVVRIENGSVIVYGTPFDGGSGIANNLSAPLGGIVFIERGEENLIFQMTSTSEILQRLYFSTARFVDKETANSMLDNFGELINSTVFYKLICNMELDAARVAHDFLIK